MSPPASVHSIRNQSEAILLSRPDSMTQEEVERIIESLEVGQKVLVWYRPLSQFKCNAGTFTYEGAFELDENEIDHVVNDRPLCATVVTTEEETYVDYDNTDEDGDYEETEYTEVGTENLDTEIEMGFSSLDCSGVWSIEVRDDLKGSVEKLTISDNENEFRFNMSTGDASIDGGDVSRADLVLLHQALNRFLLKTDAE